MFMRKSKIEKIAKAVVQKEMELERWDNLLRGIELGDFVKYEGLEYEVVGKEFSYEEYQGDPKHRPKYYYCCGDDVLLVGLIGEQAKILKFDRRNPQNLRVVYDE